MPPKSTTIDEAIDDYIKYIETEGRRSKTTVRYRGILSVFSAFSAHQGVKLLAQITTILVDQYRAERKKVLAPKSMRNEAVSLKSFLKWCKQRRLLVNNPMEDMTFQKPVPKSKGGPSLGHIDCLLGTARGLRSSQFAVLASTGMRSGELQRLRPDDVDLVGNWIHVVSRDGAETKTGHSRKVPIHSRLRPYLEAMPTKSRPWFFTATRSAKYPDGNHHINTKHVNEDLQKMLTRLEIPASRDGGFTVHSLRHSFETICVNSGIPQRVIDTWLGHRSDTSMASIYYRLSDADSQRFINQVPFGTGNPPANGGEGEF
ncbi:MAG: site-specific integrase [Planctomycetota bacterium]|nr:site-specific integrase [Planctomycetota bacterium]